MEEAFSTNKSPMLRGMKYDYWKKRDVAPNGACRPWIFFINGVLCFLKLNGSGREKEER